MLPIDISKTAHRRFDPLRGSWVLIASPHKIKRPQQSFPDNRAAPGNTYEPDCYLCPGNPRANGIRNPQYAGTYLFENDFSTVRMDEQAPNTGNDTLDIIRDPTTDILLAQSVVGYCYVLIYSVKHNYSFSELSVSEVLGIVNSWTEIFTKHRSCANEGLTPAGCLRYMQIFDNNGEMVGCSNTHPHGQIWITSSWPEESRKEFEQMKKYIESHNGRHLLQDYANLEIERKERVVWQNEVFLAVCPWWAVWPFEILLLPKRQIPTLLHMQQSERVQFAEAILQVTKIYDGLFNMTFPYISALHQAPLNASEAELNSAYLHVHFSPPQLSPSARKRFGGYELYAEPTREITPEAAAASLREVKLEISSDVDRVLNTSSASQEERIKKETVGLAVPAKETPSWWSRACVECVE